MPYVFRVFGTADAQARQTVEAALQAADFGPTAGDATVSVCVDAEDNAITMPTLQNYHARHVWTQHSTAAEVVESVRRHVESRAGASFTSTRGHSEGATFLSVVRDGLAGDGGLYILKSVPRMAASQLRYYATAHSLTYTDAAEMILEQLVDASIAPAQLHPLLMEAYDAERWSGLGNVCPMTPLLLDAETPTQGTYMEALHVLELYHGPTAAFKDFALQLFPRYFNFAVEETRAREGRQEREQYLILAATSGDTGVAAISGFVNAGGSAKVMVLYPMGGVSPVQQLQMLSFDNGRTVRVFGADSDFDFCQNTVKTIFRDGALKERLAQAQPAAVRLSSANSINWGRLIPQVAYYFWMYRQAVQGRTVVYGDSLDVVVPCGNFGNILAAYVAKLMGLPLRKLVVASNKNDVLFDFVRTGCYDIRTRALAQTASPSIDILKASNVERFLFLLSDGDTALVRTYMEDLDTKGVFTVTDAMRERMHETFWADHCSEEECAETIAAVFAASGRRRLLDPHTAVAVRVAKTFREMEVLTSGVFEAGQPVVPLVVASTAHWAKFPEPVRHAARGEPMALGDAVAPAAAAAHVRALYADLIAMGEGHLSVHPSLAAAVEAAEGAAAVTPRAVKASVSDVVTELDEFVKAV